MDWRNIARPVIIIALAVCLVLFGVYKVKETYTGFMQEYEGTYSAGGGEKIEVTIPEDTSVKEAASILKDAGLIQPQSSAGYLHTHNRYVDIGYDKDSVLRGVDQRGKIYTDSS